MKKISLFLAVTCVLSLFLLPSCGKKNEKLPENDAESDTGTYTIAGVSLVPITEDDLFRKSHLIVRATAEDDGNSFYVKNSYGVERIYTEHVFNVSETLRGEQKDKVVVRTDGGEVNGDKKIYSPAPEIKKGSEYLLFLYNPGYGGSFNTDEDYYRILGSTQGIFESSDGENYVPQYEVNEALDMETVRERADEYPIDKDLFRNEFIENQKSNLASGFIDREEYDRIISDMEIYATRVD